LPQWYNRIAPATSGEGSEVAKHPNKHIREALKYAEDHGWTIRKSSGRAHAWGVIYCQFWTSGVLDVDLFNAEKPRETCARHAANRRSLCGRLIEVLDYDLLSLFTYGADADDVARSNLGRD
jgi:hypothetical protein